MIAEVASRNLKTDLEVSGDRMKGHGQEIDADKEEEDDILVQIILMKQEAIILFTIS